MVFNATSNPNHSTILWRFSSVLPRAWLHSLPHARVLTSSIQKSETTLCYWKRYCLQTCKHVPVCRHLHDREAEIRTCSVHRLGPHLGSKLRREVGNKMAFRPCRQKLREYDHTQILYWNSSQFGGRRGGLGQHKFSLSGKQKLKWSFKDLSHWEQWQGKVTALSHFVWLVPCVGTEGILGGSERLRVSNLPVMYSACCLLAWCHHFCKNFLLCYYRFRNAAPD